MGAVQLGGLTQELEFLAAYVGCEDGALGYFLGGGREGVRLVQPDVTEVASISYCLS